MKPKYEEWLTEEGKTLLEGWAKAGLTDDEIAKNCGVGRSTLAKWKKQHPDIDRAIRVGKEVADYIVENALHRRATGYTVKEIKKYITQVDGKQIARIIEAERHIPPDTTAIIFWLKNRKPQEWRDRKDQMIDMRMIVPQIIQGESELE